MSPYLVPLNVTLTVDMLFDHDVVTTPVYPAYPRPWTVAVLASALGAMGEHLLAVYTPALPKLYPMNTHKNVLWGELCLNMLGHSRKKFRNTHN